MSDAVNGFLDETDFEKREPVEFGGPDNVGKVIGGTIIAEPRLVTLPDKLNGGEITKLVVDLALDGGDEVSLWVPPRKGMAQAIAAAVKASTASELTKGGRLDLKRVDDAAPTKPGQSGMHMFVAKYTPATPAGVGTDWDA